MNDLVKSMFVRSVEALDSKPPVSESGGSRPAPNVEALTRAFVNIREARLKAQHAWEAEDKKFREMQDRIGVAMLEFLNNTKQNSAATDAGTFYRQEELTPTGADWDAFYRWIKEHDAFEALERRIKKNFIKEYMETHEGSIPPGVSVFREYVVRVRKS